MTVYLRPKPKAPRLDRGTERRDFPLHRKFIRRHACVVPGCQGLPIECAHVRSSGDGGVGIKPHDAWTVPLCRYHHRNDQHVVGEPEFERTHGINLHALALAFAVRSPVEEVRTAAKRMEANLKGTNQ